MYTLEELKKALADYNQFIHATKSIGSPQRLLIARDLIKEEIKRRENA